ncbi:MAG: hypothetical protein WAM92_20805 [Mycobacterium sp.]
MYMLIIGTGALISGLIIGTRAQGSLGCGAVFDQSTSWYSEKAEFACTAIISENFNWTITLVVLGLALMVAGLIHAVRNRRRPSPTRPAGPK